MKRLIILSWVSILSGCALVMFSSYGKTDWSILFSGLGNTLLILPNAIWILASNKLASATMNKPPSLIVTVLAITMVLAAFLSFTLLSSVVFLEDGTSAGWFSNTAFEGTAIILLLTIFASLISASIMVSRSIIDTQDSPQAGRGSRIFVLCICFFYIAVGMFFIAPKLKKLKPKNILS